MMMMDKNSTNQYTIVIIWEDKINTSWRLNVHNQASHNVFFSSRDIVTAEWYVSDLMKVDRQIDGFDELVAAGMISFESKT